MSRPPDARTVNPGQVVGYHNAPAAGPAYASAAQPESDEALEMGPAGDPVDEHELLALETLTAIGRPFGARAATEIRRLRALVRRLARTARGRSIVLKSLRDVSSRDSTEVTTKAAPCREPKE